MILCQNCYTRFSLFILDELQYWRMETNQEISSAGGLDAIDEFSLLLISSTRPARVSSAICDM